MTRELPIRFLGTGSYVPEKVIPNQHFIDRLDTSEEWIVSRTGIRERRYAAAEETTSTMATKAAERALEDAALTADDIDVIICATATGDHQFPAAATYVQAALGVKDIPAFDVAAACAGFLHGATLAAALLTTGIYKRALVVGAELLSRFVDQEERSTAVLFGDAAGAAVLGVSIVRSTAFSILTSAVTAPGRISSSFRPGDRACLRPRPRWPSACTTCG